MMMALASTADGLAHGIKHTTVNALMCALLPRPRPLAPLMHLSFKTYVQHHSERNIGVPELQAQGGKPLRRTCKGRSLLHTTHRTEKWTKPGSKEQPSHRPSTGNDNKTAVVRFLPAARKPIPVAAASDRNNPWTRGRDRGFTHSLGAPASFACLRIGHGGHGKSKNKAD